MNPAADASGVNWQGLAGFLLIAAMLALVPLAAWAWRQRRRSPGERWRALTTLTLALVFDLILFGAFTRLSDAGLGCPDWPGCYGHASPLGAHHDIGAAQQLQPQGPVTHAKAWIEMVHRYLAATVGALILVSVALGWRWRREAGVQPAWALAALAWVLMQGAFGAWTVTLKLYPAIVTAHLLGGMGLLVLLSAQREAGRPARLAAGPGLRLLVVLAGLALAVQLALGAWVSTNYAVLACTDFPTCGGHWWPQGARFDEGFTLLRPLGRSGTEASFLPVGALVAIHWTHRLGAVVVAALVLALAAALWRAQARAEAAALLGLLLLQIASGIGNVVLGWPLAAALLHTGGAAALVMVWTRVALRTRAAPIPRPARPAPLQTVEA